jgi:orotidine-5'-phosphate decarboxylase
MGYTRGNIAVSTKTVKENATRLGIDGLTASTTNGCTHIAAPAATIEDAAYIIAVVEMTHTVIFAKHIDAHQRVEMTTIAGAGQAVRS